MPLNGDEESELTDFRTCQGTRGEEGLVGEMDVFPPSSKYLVACFFNDSIYFFLSDSHKSKCQSTILR